MNTTLTFAPHLPLAMIAALGAVALVFLAFALWRGLAGVWLRLAAFVAVLVALANPSITEEQRQSQSDIVIAVVDDSASQRLSDRAAQSEAALTSLAAQVAARGNTELRVTRVPDGADDQGSRVMQALAEAIAAEPRARIAGAVIISDGQVHDADLPVNAPAPIHLLQTGRESDWDRRLIVSDAPAFAILGEEFQLKLRIEDNGAVPASAGGEVDLTITVDSDAPQTFRVPVGQDLELPVTLPHGGMNVLQFSVPFADGELTDRNNASVIQINGVRDRLRVLLVSGEPHAGERVWRNLLKSDASVDLVHFTILRPPEKQDGVPVSELSLIAFPTRELFVEKIDEFDLIIFDRYRMRGILPMSYLQNIVDYVKNGGTVLVAAGPEYGAVDSLWRSPLAEILPAEPTTRVIEQGFRPAMTDLGRRHPVTEGLEDAAPNGGWGRWFRMIEVRPLAGQVVMEGPDATPLLILDRVEQGRVAVLASDHAWLWGRGYEGGGPQLELLRRLAHWMLKEPELEEETLTAAVKGQGLAVTRRTLEAEPPPPVTITAPDGTQSTLPLVEVSPGRFSADWAAPMLGLYRLEQGDLTRVIAIGPPAPREFVDPLASPEPLRAAVTATNGGLMRLEDGTPDLRDVRAGRQAFGRGWIGITPRDAYLTTDIRSTPLLPAWGWLILAASLAIAAWLIEGRRRARAA